MYLAGFIYNLTIPNPVRDKLFNRIINGDVVRYFATLARVETGGHWWFSSRAIYVLDV